MRTIRRSQREVLADKSGLSTNLIDVLGGISLKSISIVLVGGLMSTLFVFWAVSNASADTSSGFQTSNLGFEKAVSSSDVIVGVNDTRVGLLKDLPGDNCEVATWQHGTRDDGVTLLVDTKEVEGVCTPTTPLVAAGEGDLPQELLFGIDAPVFTYSNLGGRKITFDEAGTPTLATGAKPEAVKLSDWDDVRPYKVTLKVEKIGDKTAKVAKKAVLSSFTNVINVAVADDDLRYVPAPSTDPIPGPLRITSVDRSTVTGTTYAGAREGIAVTFAGGVCETGPTKINLSYTQQGPAEKAPVNTVFNSVLTGAHKTIHLGSVANGSSGSVEAAATCVDGGVAEKASTGYTQSIPATTLTVKQNAAPEKHDLSWIPVSSLPTSFELRWTVGAKDDELLTTTSGLAYTSVNAVGGNLGLTSKYTIVATIDSTKSPAASAEITNPLPQAPASNLVSNETGASWTAIVCTPGASPQYATRYHQQVGTDTSVKWTPLSGWSASRELKGVTTPGYGRTVTEVQSRCVADVSGVVSPTNTSNNDSFYAPEAITVRAERSLTQGAVYQGAREGVLATVSGARCYNGTPTKIDVTWQPASPSGQVSTKATDTAVQTGTGKALELANVRNGAKGNVVGEAVCTAGKSSTLSLTQAFTQPLPRPVATVADVTGTQHRVSWAAVSSLDTTFTVAKTAADYGTENSTPVSTKALNQAFSYTPGTNYANKTTYQVTATVNAIDAVADPKAITTPWPATPKVQNFSYSRTGYSGNHSSGSLAWSYTGSCPAGTTMKDRLHENRAGQSNGTFDTRTHYTSAWSDGRTRSDWAPAYAQQGYAYGVGFDVLCKSNVTGLDSPMSNTQANNFVTPMATPAVARWDGYNYREWIRGTGWMYSTCLASNSGCWSATIDWVNSCPAGSWMNWNWYVNTSWSGTRYGHSWGWQDNWKLPDAWSSSTVHYGESEYTCATPWATSPLAPKSGNVAIQVRR